MERQFLSEGASTRSVAGLVAGVLAVATGECVALIVPGARSPSHGLGRALIDATPGPAIDVGVALVVETDKPLLNAALWGLSGLTGAAGVTLFPDRPGHRTLLATIPLALGSALALRQPGRHGAGTLASGLSAAGVSALGQVFLVDVDGPFSRPRRACAAMLVAAGGVVATQSLSRRLDERARAEWAPPAQGRPSSRPIAQERLEVPGLAPLLTPPGEFYQVDVTFPAPRINGSSWRLHVGGAVDRPLDLSLTYLWAMDVEIVDALMVCVHNPVGGHRMGNGCWAAIRLAAVLERAGLSAEVFARLAEAQLIARATDGFAVVIPLEIALDHALIAIGLGDEALPYGNGFPARLLVPGLYGYAGNVKWLTAIEVVRTANEPGGNLTDGYWTSRGWPAHQGRVRPSSRIDVPRPAARLTAGSVAVAGYAWAPPAGVVGVEVCVDRGPWQRAELADTLSKLCWRAWTFTWQADPGLHELRVRCQGAAGVQEQGEVGPFPSGPAGLHRVPVRVGAARSGRFPVLLARARHSLRSRVRLAWESGRAWRVRPNVGRTQPGPRPRPAWTDRKVTMGT